MTLFTSCPRYTQCVECSLSVLCFTNGQTEKTARWMDDSTGTVVAESVVWLVSCHYRQIYCTAVGGPCSPCGDVNHLGHSKNH